MTPRDNIRQRLRPMPEIIVSIGEIGALADQADGIVTGTPALADASVQHGGLPARIGTDDQERVGYSTPPSVALNRYVARPGRVDRSTILPAVEVLGAKP